MRLSKVLFGIAMTLILALGVFALTTRSTATSTQELQVPMLEGDPIILKGGSLTIQCQANENCLPFNAVTKKHEHKDNYKKIQRIIIRDENGNVLVNLSKVNFANSRPTVEIYF